LALARSSLLRRPSLSVSTLSLALCGHGAPPLCPHAGLRAHSRHRLQLVESPRTATTSPSPSLRRASPVGVECCEPGRRRSGPAWHSARCARSSAPPQGSFTSCQPPWGSPLGTPARTRREGTYGRRYSPLRPGWHALGVNWGSFLQKGHFSKCSHTHTPLRSRVRALLRLR
jgi:hypothetical protein